MNLSHKRVWMARRRIAGVARLAVVGMLAALGVQVLVPAAPAAATAVQWLDPTYGTSGTTTIAGEGDWGGMSDPDAQGRVYLYTGTYSQDDANPDNYSDSFHLRRVLSDGTLDATFGSPLVGQGLSADNSYLFWGAMLPHADGSVAVLTYSSNGIYLSQFTGDGQPDSGFGTDGKFTIPAPPGGFEAFNAIVARPGGGYLIRLSQTGEPANTTAEYVVGVTAAGAVDTTWAPSATTPGFLQLDYSAQQQTLLAVRPGGYLVSSYNYWYDNGVYHESYYLTGLTEDGSVDPTWAAGEATPGVLPIAANPTSVTLDGTKVLVVGTINDPYPENLFPTHTRVMRLTSAGVPDPAFGSGGSLDLANGFLPSGTLQVISGAYYLTGTDYNVDTSQSALAVPKITASGSLDGSFGTGGIAYGVWSGCGSSADQVFLTATYLLVGGGGCDGTWVVDRFNLAGVLDSSYGDGGQVAVDMVGGRRASAGWGGYMQPDGKIVGVTMVPIEGTVHTDAVLFRLASSGPAAQLPGSYVPLPPSRILDTRNGNGVAAAGAIPGGGSIDLQVTGRGGVPASGVGAVVLNVTVTQPTWDGNVVAYPTGEAKPLASNLNFAQGQTIPNLVTVKVGTNGKVTLANNQIAGKTVQLVADVSGYYLSGTATEPGTYTPLVPARILDTRNGNGVAAAGAIPGGGSIDLQVTGRGGVPATGAGAVVMNVTVTQPSWDGNVVAYPTGQPKPLASNLNFAQNQTIPNLVTVKLGTDGKVTLTNNSTGSVQLVADVAGYYLAGTAVARGTFVPLPAPVRLIDTRKGTGGYTEPLGPSGEVELLFSYTGPCGGALAKLAPAKPATANPATAKPAPGKPATAKPAGCEPVPGGSSALPWWWVSAAVMNVTVTQPTWDGSLVVYPGGTTPPLASNLNFTPGTTIPNMVIAKLSDGDDNVVKFRNNSTQGTLQLIVDVSGYFNL